MFTIIICTQKQISQTNNFKSKNIGRRCGQTESLFSKMSHIEPCKAIMVHGQNAGRNNAGGHIAGGKMPVKIAS